MDDKLFMRVYNVGFGDCIYIRVPDQDQFYHILIDCGTSRNAETVLKGAIDDVIRMLPDKCLDLLVVTHPHADHINGFNFDWFSGITIKRIWLSAFMKEGHPQATNSHALQALTDKAVKSLLAHGLCSGTEVETLLLNSVSNNTALETLRMDLPGKNGIEPLYVSRDIAEQLNEKECKLHSIVFEKGTTCFRGFQEEGTCIRMLAPEWDIDGYYLGKGITSVDYTGLYNFYEYSHERAEKKGGLDKPVKPANISEEDFERLRSRIISAGLSFSQMDNELKNNTSIVLLLEWRGRRLLFTGDAEWRNKKFTKKKNNSCWNVMLEKDKDYGHLSKPIDLLKVGHHGSINGSPFSAEEGFDHAVLDNLLPEQGQGLAVVSTLAGKHGETNPVPYPKLMEELGRRITNACEYRDNPGVKQPPRTDLENKHIDLTIESLA